MDKGGNANEQYFLLHPPIILTLSHTIPNFSKPMTEALFEHAVEKAENAGKLVTSIFSFSHNVFILP